MTSVCEPASIWTPLNWSGYSVVNAWVVLPQAFQLCGGAAIW